MRPVLLAVSLCSVLLLSAAQAQTPLPPGTWPIADAPPQLREPISRADLIVVSLQDALRRELTSALEKGGAAFAIQSCHVDVGGTIQRIERDKGIRAGRTSDRLRNSANAPKPWAAALVQTYAGRRAREVDGFVVDLGVTVGVLRPIAEQPLCASCHGPAKDIAPPVRSALNNRYPHDRAVGFADGEIRGWFWVEVPKTPR